MEKTTLTLPDGRNIWLAPFFDSSEFHAEGPFVVWFPAGSPADLARASALLPLTLAVGGVEICCVGPCAESMHDGVDAWLETEGRLDVVTVWFADDREALEYTLWASQVGRASLLAFVAEQPEIIARFREAVQ